MSPILNVRTILWHDFFCFGPKFGMALAFLKRGLLTSRSKLTAGLSSSSIKMVKFLGQDEAIAIDQVRTLS